MEVFASTHHVMAIVHALLFESQSPYLHVLSNAHALLLKTPFEIEMIVFLCVFFYIILIRERFVSCADLFIMDVILPIANLLHFSFVCDSSFDI